MEVRELRHQAGKSIGVALAVGAAGGGDVGGDDRDPEAQRQAQAFRVAKVVLGMGERALIAGVGEQRQVVVLEAFVEGSQALIGRIDVHDAGDPLHQDRTLRRAGVQAFDRVMPPGVDRGSEEQVRIPGHLPGQELVGHMDLGGGDEF
jgi:hypothetical protein